MDTPSTIRNKILINHTLINMSCIVFNFNYYRRFGPKCSGCGMGISPQDLVRKAREKVFHLKCFTCFVCRKQLLTGEELYVVDDTKFVCKEDYNHRLNGETLLPQYSLLNLSLLHTFKNLVNRQMLFNFFSLIHKYCSHFKFHLLNTSLWFAHRYLAQWSIHWAIR